ncbi:hypothetical protein HDU84_009652, partial [Entophlyctis sp. JEL0112]
MSASNNPLSGFTSGGGPSAVIIGGYIGAVVSVLGGIAATVQLYRMRAILAKSRQEGVLTEVLNRIFFAKVTYRLILNISILLAAVSVVLSIWAIATFGATDWTSWLSLIAALLMEWFLNSLSDRSFTFGNGAIPENQTDPSTHQMTAQPENQESLVVEEQAVATQVDKVPRKFTSLVVHDNHAANVAQVTPAHSLGVASAAPSGSGGVAGSIVGTISGGIAIGAAIACTVSVVNVGTSSNKVNSASQGITYQSASVGDICASVTAAGYTLSHSCCTALVGVVDDQTCFNAYDSFLSSIGSSGLTETAQCWVSCIENLDIITDYSNFNLVVTLV